MVDCSVFVEPDNVDEVVTSAEGKKVSGTFYKLQNDTSLKPKTPHNCVVFLVLNSGDGENRTPVRIGV